MNYLVLFALLFLTLTGCSKGLEEVDDPSKVFVPIEIEGISFDVPLNYLYRSYIVSKKWQIDPDAPRRKYTRLDFKLSLLDYQGWNEQNKHMYEPGCHDSVLIYASKAVDPSWSYNYLSSVGDQLITPRDPNPIPGLQQFEYRPLNEQVYLSSKLPSKDLIRIRCSNRPGCGTCSTRILYGDRLSVGLTYPKSYLSQWKEVHAQVKNILDHIMTE